MVVDSTLIRACSILFLFRSLAALDPSEDREQSAQIEAQILRLLGDLAGNGQGSGFVLLAGSEPELLALAKERGLAVDLVERICREGAVNCGVPLYARGSIA